MKSRLFSYALIISWLVSGCATIESPALGDQLTASPGWDRIKQRFSTTITRAGFWAPLATAAVLQLNDLDHRISDRLREETPVFGSNQEAADASDDLRSLTKFAYITTAIAAPVSNDTNWFSIKSKLLATEWLGVKSTSAITGILKDTTDRERPDGSNYRSFPSGHASGSAVQANLAIFNTQYLPLAETAKSTMTAGFNTLAIGTAWARVEAGVHYPSDVLSGWALGYLMSELTTVFIDGEAGRQLLSMGYNVEDGWLLNYQYRF